MLLSQNSIRIYACISQPLICFWNASADQLDEVCNAYTSLWSSVSNEAQARDIYDSLVAIALTDDKPSPTRWLASELRFEAFAAATSDRQWAALMELEHNSNVITDTELDLYNERISREL
ncbi:MULTISPECIES: hypothetical protein [unclassified Spirosoma]|uniref:hypothetical protein n=1 Tax=unclassified Spirosoma TaxID=2621999 RepID=UPI0009638F58|nr:MULTISPECIES: hypothetical protein [unclassified Spirosoma]MBN8822936.1 hypothetical protein [Spirosoma sp.]OJW80121.1 MAG: hypothetical protein BGO59_02645 [Spirosoma sp. 48-14]